MLREVTHFILTAPGALRLKRQLNDQAAFYDALMDRTNAAGLGTWRHELVSELTGEILEVGAGTGVMFPHYNPAARVTALELDDAFAERARRRATTVTAPITVVTGDAQRLPFPDACFGHVVIGMALCSVADVLAVLAEVRRVLRSGGELRLIEHVRSERRVTGLLMDAFNPLWLVLNGQGCHMNRDTLAMLRAADFALQEVRSFQVYAPGLPAFPMRWIRASPCGC